MTRGMYNMSKCVERIISKIYLSAIEIQSISNKFKDIGAAMKSLRLVIELEFQNSFSLQEL